MSMPKIAEGLLEVCFLFLGSATVSALVVGYSVFLFKLVYRFTADKKEGNNEDH